MTPKKQRKNSPLAKGAGGFEQAGMSPQDQADRLLVDIISAQAEIDRITAAFNEAVADLQEKCEAKLQIPKTLLEAAQKGIAQVMKFEKKVLFADTDVVNLAHGSLIRALVDKVKIPKDREKVIAFCEELGFPEVVKIVKSLDREAVEKWPDERLLLIGAERKQKEEFSYDLKKEKAL